MMVFLPADMAKICFGHRSRMTARAVTRAFNARLRPLNLQITQYTLLAAISMDGDRPIAALADELDLEPSTLQRNLKLLESRGLLTIDGGRGRNGRRHRITPAGFALLEAGVPIWTRIQADFASILGGRAEQTRAALAALERAALRLERSPA
jgi:DNA-binding MarR family transcriptional regulator